MEKWADFVISQVSYDSKHLISKAKRHKDSENGIGKGELVDRTTMTSDIMGGSIYITIYSRISTWKRGNKIRLFRIGGEQYLRTDKNKVNLDNLGDLPEVAPSTEPAPEPVIEEEPAPEPVIEEEPAPEQLHKLTALQNQINKLEESLSDYEPSNVKNISEQPSYATDIEKEKEKTEFDIDYEIIRTLQKQKQRLDDIEKKLHTDNP